MGLSAFSFLLIQLTFVCVESEKGYLRGRVVRVPSDVAWEVVVAVVHTHRVDLLFVALDTVRSTNVITEEPSLVLDSVAGEGVHGTACEERRADRSEVSVD